MKKVLLLAGAMLALTAGLASANGLSMHYNDCGAGVPAFNLSSPDINCGSNAGAPISLVLSVIPAGGDLDNINGAQGIVDIQMDAATQVSWWDLVTGTGCRAGRLSASAATGDVVAPFNCINAWANVGNATAAANFEWDEGVAQRGRITWIVGIPGETTFLQADGEHYLVTLSITKGSTTSCAGCDVAACLVANEARMTRPAEDQRGDVFIYDGPNTYVTFQGGGTLACPGSTPASTGTWGQLKSLYR